MAIDETAKEVSGWHVRYDLCDYVDDVVVATSSVVLTADI